MKTMSAVYPATGGNGAASERANQQQQQQATALRPAGGRVARRPSKSGSGLAKPEIKMYLSKLKDLVPFMPKDRKVSNLEVIHHVIDYICDLETFLEPLDAAAAYLDHRRHMEVEDEISNEIDPLAERLAADDAEDCRDDEPEQLGKSANDSESSQLNAARQPLSDRRSPNPTALPAAHAVGAPTATTTTSTSTLAAAVNVSVAADSLKVAVSTAISPAALKTTTTTTAFASSISANSESNSDMQMETEIHGDGEEELEQQEVAESQ